ncbi:MAG: LON peptidase substrate-binding domain-containing protein [Solirubrobacterales bacterium]
MAGDRETDFPIFPLGMVALPEELVPLHIFEPRYRTMINLCLETDGQFGIVWTDDDGAHATGCAMEVSEVVERMDDGRLNIITRGVRPFRVVEERHDLPYPAATVEFLEDEEEAPDRDAGRAARAAYAELVEEATDRELDDESLGAMDSWAMAATVDFGLEAKQGLLDLRSENARLALVARLMRAAVKRIEFVERAQVRALSNGRVRFG